MKTHTHTHTQGRV